MALFDVIVIGESVAGYACATFLRKSGYSVAISEHIDDTVSVEDLGACSLSALGIRAVESSSALTRIRRVVSDAGVVRIPSVCELLGRVGGRYRYATAVSPSGVVSARAVVYAPNGSQPAVHSSWSAFVGTQVSFGARADARYFARGRVGLVGSGERLVSEARWLREWGVWSIAFVRSVSIDGVHRGLDVCQVYLGVGRVLPVASASDRLSAVEFQSHGRLVSEQLDALVFADEPVASERLLPDDLDGVFRVESKGETVRLGEGGALWHDLDGLWQHGLEVARRCAGALG